jgi:hypothetical protein
MIRWTGDAAYRKEMKNTHETLTQTSEVYRPLAITRHTWTNDIKIRESLFQLQSMFS